jgi:uroporphyrinogen decarboxylase
MNFGEADRTLLWEFGYWKETLVRWYEEGLPRIEGNPELRETGEGIRAESSPHDVYSLSRVRDIDAHKHFGFDEGIVGIPLNMGPMPYFEKTVLEEDAAFKVIRDEFGVSKKINKTSASIPCAIDWPVKNTKDFETMKKERLIPNFADRIPNNWDSLVKTYRDRSYPLAVGGYPFGFYGMCRLLIGEEELLVTFYDNPGLVRNIMSHFTDLWLSLWEELFAYIEPDAVFFWEDMAYRNGSIISPSMFREFMTPCYKKLTDFLKTRGVSVILVDTDGRVDELVPLFLEAGLTGLYPFEVQAGNDICVYRKNYPKLQILGGLDKIAVSRGRESTERELAVKLPGMLKQGGFIPYLDHLVPPDISFVDFSFYRKRLREYIEA